MPPSRRLSSSPARALRTSLVGLAALAMLRAVPAHAGWLSADPTYAGYRIPEHRWSRWTASLLGSAFHSTSASPFATEYRENGFTGALASYMDAAYDSDPLMHQWSLRVNTDARRRHTIDDFSSPPVSSRSDRTQEDLSERFSWSGYLRSYPWRTPIALTGSMTHALTLNQTFERSDQVSVSPPNESRYTSSQGFGTRRYFAQVSLGTGVGRVRDATPVYRAQVLESRLRASGALSRELSEDARRKLAALFTTQFGFGTVHDRPDKYFWREVERLLREDGALAGGSLDAYTVLRLLENVWIGNFVARSVGWFVGPTVYLSTTRDRVTDENSYSVVTYVSGVPVSTTENRSERTENLRRDDVFTGLESELHVPLDPRWQLDLSSRLALSEAGETLFGSSSAGLAWMVSDRWLASLLVRHSFSSPGHGLERRPRSWSGGLGAELAYFLEDSWALRLTANESQSNSGSYFQRSGQVQVGITYLISGYFHVPGLVEPMRPGSPTP